MRRPNALLAALGATISGKGEKKDISAFKSQIWQTDEISASFMKGSDPDQVPLADVMDREVNTYFLSQCAPTDRVLDIGCGHGLVSEFIASHGISVTAIDISETLLDELRRRTKDRDLPLTIIRGDAYDIPAADGSFDKVVARMFLPHFPDWRKVLREFARVTAPGGRLMIDFPSKENTLTARTLGDQACRFATDPDTDDPWVFYAEIDRNDLEAEAVRLGLNVLPRVPVSFFSHNRIIGHQLGQAQFDRYQLELSSRLSNESVKEFVVWFDAIFTAQASPALSHFAIVNLEKPA